MMDQHGDHLSEAQLHDAAEGVLPAAERAAAERHLAYCGECHTDVERIRALLAEAETLPRAIEPPADVWLGIQAKVSGAGKAASATRGALAETTTVPLRRRPRREYLWLAAAALLLVVSSSAITMLAVDGNDLPLIVNDPVNSGPAEGASPSPEFVEVRDEYARLDRDLAAKLAEHREKLQPETIQKVERNLRIIDRAITEIRQALAEDPHNEALEQLLKASYGQKSALLQQVSQS